MDREDFQKVLRKYLQGRATAEERRIVDGWYNRMGKDKPDFVPADEQLEMRYWSGINTHIRSSRKDDRPGMWRWYSIAVAAAVVFLVVCSVYISQSNNGEYLQAPKPAQLPDQTLSNDGDEPQQVSLPDGSVVVLQPKSRLRVASAFSKKERKVFLYGQAFFEVVHDAARPFKVYTDDVITEVLGTSFTVSAFGWEKDVKVSVVTGKVSVYKKQDAQTKTSEVILTPNQEFVFNRQERKVLKTIVKEPLAIIPAEELRRMRFEETSPKIVFEAIEKVYGVDVVFDEKKFSTCRITTNISDGNIFNRLLIICEVINASYKVEEGKIVIEGDGCYANL